MATTGIPESADFAVISPSSTLTLKFREIAEKRSLRCIIVQASQMDAPQVVRRLMDKGVKVFISRGNTAKVLKKYGICKWKMEIVSHKILLCH